MEKNLLLNPVTVPLIAACDCCFLFLCSAERSLDLPSLYTLNIETQLLDSPLAFSTLKPRSLSCRFYATCSTPVSTLEKIWIYSTLPLTFLCRGSPGEHSTSETHSPVLNREKKSPLYMLIVLLLMKPPVWLAWMTAGTHSQCGQPFNQDLQAHFWKVFPQLVSPQSVNLHWLMSVTDLSLFKWTYDVPVCLFLKLDDILLTVLSLAFPWTALHSQFSWELLEKERGGYKCVFCFLFCEILRKIKILKRGKEIAVRVQKGLVAPWGLGAGGFRGSLGH